MVGLFLLLGIVLIAFLAVNLGNLSRGSKETYSIQVNFRNAAGLIKGSEVRLGGAKIGNVSTTPVISANGAAVSVTLNLEKGVTLYKGCVVQVGTLNLLGDKYIEISQPATPSQNIIQPGAILEGDSGDDLDTIKTNVATISQQTVVLLDRVEDAMEDMQKAAKGFADLADRLNQGVLSDKNIQNLEKTMGNVALTSENLAKASDSVPETLENIREVTQNVRDTTGNLNTLVVKIDKKVDELEPAFDNIVPLMENLKQTSVKLDKAVANADKVITKVEKGNGIMGALLNDASMKKDVQDFIKHLRAQGILRYKNPNAEEEAIDMRDRARMQGRRN